MNSGLTVQQHIHHIRRRSLRLKSLTEIRKKEDDRCFGRNIQNCMTYVYNNLFTCTYFFSSSFVQYIYVVNRNLAK